MCGEGLKSENAFQEGNAHEIHADHTMMPPCPGAITRNIPGYEILSAYLRRSLDHRETHLVKLLVLGAALWYYGCISHKGDIK